MLLHSATTYLIEVLRVVIDAEAVAQYSGVAFATLSWDVHPVLRDEYHRAIVPALRAWLATCLHTLVVGVGLAPHMQ